MIHSYVFSAIMKAIVSDAASENERGQIARNTLHPRGGRRKLGSQNYDCDRDGSSILGRYRRSASPHRSHPWPVWSFNLLKAITLRSWWIIDVSVRIGEAEKRQPLDGSHRPCLGGIRQHHHAKAQTGDGRTELDHFGIPLF
jgi:hypothetical protein